MQVSVETTSSIERRMTIGVPADQVDQEVEQRLHDLPCRITIAVMGCVVNGPGEASEADLGIAGGKGQGLLFRKGKVVRKVPQDELADALVEEALRLAEEQGS